MNVADILELRRDAVDAGGRHLECMAGSDVDIAQDTPNNTDGRVTVIFVFTLSSQFLVLIGLNNSSNISRRYYVSQQGCNRIK